MIDLLDSETSGAFGSVHFVSWVKTLFSEFHTHILHEFSFTLVDWIHALATGPLAWDIKLVNKTPLGIRCVFSYYCYLFPSYVCGPVKIRTSSPRSSSDVSAQRFSSSPPDSGTNNGWIWLTGLAKNFPGSPMEVRAPSQSSLGCGVGGLR